MRAIQTTRRYARLLSRYLGPEWVRMALLTVILVAAMSVQLITPLVAGLFLDQATGGVALRGLVWLAVLTMILGVVRQGVAVAETYVAESVSWAATNALRVELVAHLLRLDASFHATRTTGELIERVDGDVATLARFFSRFVVYVLGNGLLILGVLVLLFTVDWRVGLGLSAFVVVAIASLLLIRASTTPFSIAERQASASFFGFLSEYLGGLEDIRSSGAVAFVLRRFTEILRSWRALSIRSGMGGYAMSATSQGLFALGMAVAFGLGAWLHQEGTLTVGTVYMIYRYTEVLRQPTEQLREEVQDLRQADASMVRVEALLATRPVLLDGPGLPLPPGPLSIDLEHVSFGYATAGDVLRDVSVRLAPGHVLGIVGRTGSGKTTLTRLLMRFIDPDSGCVRIGGINVKDAHLATLRTRVGLVTQDVQLFRASVRDNVTLFDSTVSDYQIQRVLEELGLATWLDDMPDGLNTQLGPTGAALSAGQAQILACARVFLRNPDVVILDEASSRLDPYTEHLVHAAMSRLLDGRTGVIVAHRLSTVSLASDILVLEDGRVWEIGSRSDLAADPSSRFAQMLRVAIAGAPR